MKQLLSVIFSTLCVLSLFSLQQAQAQCTPDASKTAPGYYTGVSDNSLPAATLGKAYSETITIVVPKDTIYLGVKATIDSLIITDIQGLPDGISASGNPSNMSYIGGQKACVLLSGTPSNASQVGANKLSIKVILVLTALGKQHQLPQSVDDFEMNVIGPPSSVGSNDKNSMTAIRNQPNPFKEETNISFDAAKSGTVNLIIYNTIGERVFLDGIDAKKGSNSYLFKTGDLPAGIYVYSLNDGTQERLSRMVISEF